VELRLAIDVTPERAALHPREARLGVDEDAVHQ